MVNRLEKSSPRIKKAYGHFSLPQQCGVFCLIDCQKKNLRIRSGFFLAKLAGLCILVEVRF
nr:MAG TPA: hypothetical protein [Caudoviricetes sp.]